MLTHTGPQELRYEVSCGVPFVPFAASHAAYPGVSLGEKQTQEINFSEAEKC